MVETENNQSVGQYCEYFRKTVTEIRCVSKDLFKGILLLSAVETLAKSRYAPQLTGEGELGNGERFKRLVCEHGEWPNVERYSIPQIVYGLEELGFTSSNLYVTASKRLEAWRIGGAVHLEDDFEAAEIAQLCEADTKALSVVNNARHDALLWTYRNNMIHEFREPGHPWPFPQQRVPCYISMEVIGDIDPKEQPKTWELSYPIQWLEDLVLGIVESLSAHWITASLDPYDGYDFGPLWRK